MENFEKNPYENNEQNNSTNNDFVSGSGSYDEKPTNPYANNNPYSEHERNNPYSTHENNYSRDANENPYVNNNPYKNENPYTNENPYVSAYNPYVNGDNDLYEEKKPKKGLGIASMVLGILSITLCCCSVFGGVIAIIGLILGIISQTKGANGFALAGIITCGFGIAFGILGTVMLISGVIDEFMYEFENMMESSYGDSSFNNNNNAIVTFVKHLFSFIK